VPTPPASVSFRGFRGKCYSQSNMQHGSTLGRLCRRAMIGDPQLGDYSVSLILRMVGLPRKQVCHSTISSHQSV